MVKIAKLTEDEVMAGHTTMQVGGKADFFCEAKTEDEIVAACEWAAGRGLGVFVLGEGSNVVVSDSGLRKLVLRMRIMGVEKLTEDDESLTMRIGAGEHWDDVVKRSVQLGLSGIEAMSGIPGTAGATPVQNAGAYGQEIRDTFVELEAYDLRAKEFVKLDADDCDFSYRMSAFKSHEAGRYVICYITLRLRKQPPRRPSYESLRRYLDEHDISEPTIAQIREGVLSVRARILPDPSVVPNTGSFFESPIVTAEKLHEIEKKFGKVPSFVYGDKHKIPAGWIVEQCGFKGSEHFGFVIWKNHALVITNPNGGDFAHLMKMVDLIVGTVKEKFGLVLEPEPLFAR